jgi:hypothetical protein
MKIHTTFKTRARILQLLVAGAALLTAAGCASSRNIPFTIHSDPQGAYVMMQTQESDKPSSEWVYLGNTPLMMTREVNVKEIKNAKAIVIKVMKEGYFDQTKVWKGREFLNEEKEKGRIFWNPLLVPSRR